MRILGIDPSLQATGYGVVDSNAASLRLVEGGMLSTAPSKELSLRLVELQRALSQLIRCLHPDVMVIEEVFSKTAYPRAAIFVAHARGALVCTAALAGLPVYHYAATSVKRSLVGRGAAPKAQVARMVAQLLRLRRTPSPNHVTDALALAIVHARRNGRNGA